MQIARKNNPEGVVTAKMPLYLPRCITPGSLWTCHGPSWAFAQDGDTRDLQGHWRVGEEPDSGGRGQGEGS